MKEDTSVFIKKYKQILLFKSNTNNKKEKMNRYNLKTYDSLNKKKILSFILPNISNNNTKNMACQINSKKETSRPKKSENKILDNPNPLDISKSNNKLQIRQSAINPKKIIKEINESFYKRLLNKSRIELINNSSDDIKNDSSKEEIKLPFLINNKPINSNKKNNNLLLNKSLILPETAKTQVLKKSK